MIWLLLAGCHAPDPLGRPVDATVTGAAMGGDLRIVVRCPEAREQPACVSEGLAARAEIDRIEALATDWKPGGEVSALNAAAGRSSVPISPEVQAMLATAARVSAASEGAFDVTIGALWGLWNFDEGVIPAPDVLAARVKLVDWRRLVVGDGTAELPEAGMAVTLGGVAQGYAAQRALAVIPAGHEAIVDLSGDVCVRGTWDVGIQDPRGPRGATVATVTLRDACLTTAGDYEKAFVRDGVRYHHILDPRTGMPATGARSATVISADGSLADALDTTLVVRGPDEALVDGLGAWAYVIDADGKPHTLGRSDAVVRVR